MRSARELWKEKDDSRLAPEEMLLKYGENKPRQMMYAKVKQGGEEVIVAREFAPGEVIPKDWKDSPAAFGIETEPQRKDFDPGHMPIIARMPTASPQAVADEGKDSKGGK